MPEATASTRAPDAQPTAHADAALAAALIAVDPTGLGGALLRGPPGTARDRWLQQLRELLPAEAPWRRVPSHIGDERLLGGLDLAATLQAGRSVVRWGLLREADGGLLVLAMAERMAPTLAARIAAVMDTHTVSLQREGLSLTEPARLGVVALDEGESDDEQLPAVLAERLALHLRLDPAASPSPSHAPTWDADQVARARERLPALALQGALVTALCEAAARLGIATLRAPWLAWRTACAACALRGGTVVSTDDAALAARLVLGPRATLWPASAAPPAPDAPAPEDAAAQAPADGAAPPPSRSAASPPTLTPAAAPPDQACAPADMAEAGNPTDRAQAEAPSDAGLPGLQDQLLQAAMASLPAGLLATAAAPGPRRAGARAAGGHSGSTQRSLARGRPIGVQPGELRAGARLDLVQTLRAAAPWQALRRRELERPTAGAVLVRREDFRLRRFQQRQESLTIFAVDASGSQALHRLAEAKGAVELLLADCYVRRDKVAVLAFRGRCAELLLAPTRSLVRAKRCLAGLPGGGGTPLASGIDAARSLADGAARQGCTPLLVLLTDGRANISRGGAPGRPQATADALASARAWQQSGRAALLLDTAPQPQAQARDLAQALGARYLALPGAGARTLAQAVAAQQPQRARPVGA